MLVKKGFERSDLSEPGIELKIIPDITRRYKPSPRDETGMYYWRPDPDEFRVGLTLAEEAVIPAWNPAGTKIAAGGTVMIAQKDVQALAEALLSIRDGKAAPEEALFTENAVGVTVPKFILSVSSPGAEMENLGYVPVQLNDATKEISAQFGGAALKLRTLNAQMYPERASFKQKKFAPV
jgi:hypothetical protein